MEGGPMTREQEVRLCANHLALVVWGGVGAFTLVERDARKRVVGRYRTVDTLERGIERYGAQELKRLEQRLGR
jgi:hypothetical protein